MAVTGWFATLVVIEVLKIGPQATGGPAGREYRVGREKTGIDDLLLPVDFYPAVEGVDEHDFLQGSDRKSVPPVTVGLKITH